MRYLYNGNYLRGVGWVLVWILEIKVIFLLSNLVL